VKLEQTAEELTRSTPCARAIGPPPGRHTVCDIERPMDASDSTAGRGANEIRSAFLGLPGRGRVRLLVAGDGPQALLLVHGWPTSARVFWPLLTAPTLRARFRMLAPDLFGFGRSTLRDRQLTFDLEVDAVLEVARCAGRPCVAVGVSLGARVLLEAVSRRPELFERVVLLAPYLHRGLLQDSPALRTLASLPRPVARALYSPPLSIVTGLWSAAGSLLAGGDFRPWAAQALPLIADVARMRPETLDLVGALPDGRGLLRDLGVPLEVWYGDRDRLLDPCELAELASVPGLKVVRLAGAGHALHESHAGELAAALLS
jgi:pimeloyl-ACP methyl ester carboxylesterase